MNRKLELRYLAHAELRARKGDKPGIEGYAAVFNELSEELGWFGRFREIIMPGAFTDCLASDPDVRALWNHDANHVLGRTRAKTLTLAEDEKGLKFSCDLPDTQTARDLLTSIKRGDINQCSFGFVVKKEKLAPPEEGSDDPMIRELYAVDLFDVSPVTFPAYPQTSVDARALWPNGRPRMVRVLQQLNAELRQDEPENANGCSCDCTDCAENDACDECSNVACDDAECEDAGCPNQDQEPEENSFNPLHEFRGAVSFKQTPADDSDTWDAAAARGRLAKWASSDGSGDKDKVDWGKYAQGFGWVDPEQKDNFGGYKLPHHDVKDGRLVSVWGGVQGAMNALLGGRGGTDMPEGDRRAVYNHLAKEYKIHGKDVPDFHSLHSFLPDAAELERLRLQAQVAAAR